MLDNPLITILTPCYNAEKDIQRFIDCVLSQTYDNIEIILINDGSTDKTEEIILKNKESLEKKCSKFIYIKQDNSGVGAAVNNGLKSVTGKYLTWPDYDDILYPDYLEKKVKFLEDNPDISLCFNPADIVKEDDINTINGKLERVSGDDSKIMDDFILARNAVFSPITSCIKSEDFWKINPSRNIYPSRNGQNWQILLPMLYNYQIGYIQESLAKYVVRKNSHSHGNYYKKLLKRIFGLISILFNTIKTIKMSPKEKNHYFALVIKHYGRIIIKEFFTKLLFVRQIKSLLKK